VLGQLGHRVQHALRAFTPDDEKALKAAARTYPRTDFYDVEKTLTTLGIGEALVTVLSPQGVPTPPFVTRMIPPVSRMGPLTDLELGQRLEASQQVREYSKPIDRESAREKLAERVPAASSPAGGSSEEQPEVVKRTRASAKPSPDALEQILKSPVARTVAGAVTRGLLGALLGTPSRRRRRSMF
jgi:hypothetical protein